MTNDSPFTVEAELVYDAATDTLAPVPQRFVVQRYEDGFRLGAGPKSFDTRHEAEAWVARQTDRGRHTTLSGSQGRTVYYVITDLTEEA